VSDIPTTIISVAPYVGLATGVFIPVLLWARSVSEQLTFIRDNHLAHIESHVSKTNELLIEIRTILAERGQP
jgi:hypothetical protein